MSQKRKKRKLPALLQVPGYYALRAAVAATLASDIGSATRAASGLGRWFASIPPNRKRLQRAIDNLAVAFPDWDQDRRREYAAFSYQHLFMLAIETGFTPRLLSEDGWSDHLRLGGLGESVRHMLAGQLGPTDPARRPCVLISGHSGNWELLGYAMALLGFPIHALYRPLDLAPLDRWVRTTRQRRGLVLVDKFGAVDDLPRLMHSGGAAGFVADQNAGDRGLFVPFFGRLASTYKTIGLLAMQHEAPVICGQARRLVRGRDEEEETSREVSSSVASEWETLSRAGANGSAGGMVGFQEWGGESFRYTIDVIDVIKPEDWRSQPDPLFYVTARYRRAIELGVRRAPEQYLWMHRYWKSRPRHERTGKPFPPALREKIEQLPWITPDDVARIVEWSHRDTREVAGT
jgi:KDO2-lipid IV(A) lauroyltransferase